MGSCEMMLWVCAPFIETEKELRTEQRRENRHFKNGVTNGNNRDKFFSCVSFQNEGNLDKKYGISQYSNSLIFLYLL